jgi:hypothetical protein
MNKTKTTTTGSAYQTNKREIERERVMPQLHEDGANRQDSHNHTEDMHDKGNEKYACRARLWLAHTGQNK